MFNNKIKCEVVSVAGEGHCTGAAKMKKGDTFIIGAKTPEPNGICARSFAALYPVAAAMRFSEETSWEKEGRCLLACPDGTVTYSLTRVI